MIELDDVQSTILRPSSASHLQLSFLRADDAAAMARLCAAAAGDHDGDGPLAVTSVARHDELHHATGGPVPTTAVGLTPTGLRLAGISTRAHDALSGSFTAGMRAAADRLGDRYRSDPSHWSPPFRPEGDPPGLPAVHAVVLRYGDGPLAPLVADGRRLPDGVTALATTWDGARRAGDTEPFGFRDNLTEPAVDGAGWHGGPPEVTPGNGAWDPEAGRWRAVAAGELVLGEVDESGAVAGLPDAAHLERNGSYLAIRKLEQDVAGFAAACAAWAAELGPGWTADEVAAQLVGRSRDGCPVGRHGGPSNDFLYRDERFGPVGVAPSAHIRRANPRDDMAFAEHVVPRHQLWRRGLPYGEPGSGDEGLLFLACCADLRRQFEFVQSQWLQDGDRFGLGAERDPLTGQRDDPHHDRSASIDLLRDGEHTRIRRALATFVTTRGGEYVLLPSLSALALLGSRGPRA